MNNIGLRTSPAILLILHALLWAFALLLVDALWGGDLTMWMTVGFVVGNGLLLSFLHRKQDQKKST